MGVGGADSWAGRGMFLRKDKQGMNTPAPDLTLVHRKGQLHNDAQLQPTSSSPLKSL